MKLFLVLITLVGTTILANAQTPQGSGARRAAAGPKKSQTQLRGSGQYHGSKDTTPGSPIGTGGAGGSEMSGSPSGSASQSALQSKNEKAQADDQAAAAAGEAPKAKRTTIKTRSGHRNRRM